MLQLVGGGEPTPLGPCASHGPSQVPEPGRRNDSRRSYNSSGFYDKIELNRMNLFLLTQKWSKASNFLWFGSIVQC